MAYNDTRKIGERKAGNAGLVTTTAGPDLLHTIPLMRSFVVRKIMWYNNTGGNATLQFGTRSGVPAFVALLPTFLAINTFNGGIAEDDLPAVEFILNSSTVAAVAREGSAWVQCSVVGVLVAIEVEEFGS